MSPRLLLTISISFFLIFITIPNFAHANEFQGECGEEEIDTAIGCIPYELNALVTTLIRWGIGISGGLLIIVIAFGAFFITTASGDPKKVKAGQELITAAIGGIILIIFSVIILNLLGVTILNLENLGFQIN